MYLFIIYTMLRNHGTGFSSSESHLQPECVQHFQRGRLPPCLVGIELACREEGTVAPSLVSKPGTPRAVSVVHSTSSANASQCCHGGAAFEGLGQLLIVNDHFKDCDAVIGAVGLNLQMLRPFNPDPQVMVTPAIKPCLLLFHNYILPLL